MTSYVPRKSREVHAYRVLRQVGDEGHVEYADGGRVSRAECVCEEPCRYCHCEVKP